MGPRAYLLGSNLYHLGANCDFRQIIHLHRALHLVHLNNGNNRTNLKGRWEDHPHSSIKARGTVPGK